MITELIADALFFIPRFLLGLLPALGVSIPVGVVDALEDVMYGLGYFIPLAALAPIFLIAFSFHSGKTIWAIVVRIKSFIPTMGA